MTKYISIKNAKEHNLKGISIDIPKNTLTVITGLSGSGKSSLAFDTIYAEGQRRYVESLSAYARQFLDTFDKPDVESIDGLSPAISIEQKTTSKNPRSTVGTITEIYDYLRLLFARVGVPYSPATGLPIEKQSVSQMVDKIMELPQNTKIYIIAPIVRGRKGEYKKEFETFKRQGYQRVKVDGNVYEVDSIPAIDKNIKHNISIIVDRLVIKEGIEERLAQSIETTLNLSLGIVVVERLDNNEEMILSANFSCPVSGFSIEEIEPRLFSFNNPFGACSNCNGLGIETVFNERLIIPNKYAPLIEAIAPWNTRFEGYYRKLLISLAQAYEIDPNTPYINLPSSFQKVILYGSGNKKINFNFESTNVSYATKKAFEGIIPSLERRFRETTSDTSRENLSAFQSETTCKSCLGQRVNPKALQVKIHNTNIHQVTELSIKECSKWMKEAVKTFNDNQNKIAEKIVKEITERLLFLENVGIGYLTLSRRSGTLSGGESQRIRLASQIGSGLTGVIYILDEPSIGLHQRDNDKLIETLNHLKNLDNTVIVVEHDEDTIKEADFIIDMGPLAGIHGGEVVAKGSLKEILKNKDSITAKYLKKELAIHIPKTRRSGNGKFIKINKASANNLKHIDVKIPLGKLVCVTGVSGSGKSTLINETLYKAASEHVYSNYKGIPAIHDSIDGLENIDKVINIDQSPIGRTPTSNPATYTKVFDLIRNIFAELPEAKARGYKAGRFSFNVKGGRCETCSGDGTIKISMHFLPDVHILCSECNGQRYNRETLEIKWKGKSISDILSMTIDDAYKYFDKIASIKNKLKALVEVGLGYLTMGQSALTLSGGEAQRVKLARELAKKSTGKTLYILDEPTTGLHFHDINRLLQILHTLVDQGNSILVIEHNLDVIKTADHIIDVGPEGGDQGGKIIAQGTPEEVSKIKSSYTGAYIKKILQTQ